ncbi:prenyltransferase [Alteromonas facilis]|uniref:prenyltransferase n=1 Tax=Alteromonas facilis TaxID=2048004 RepID=UPI000C2861E9|nr:prenyltransferase [Alteromonas facilis]
MAAFSTIASVSRPPFLLLVASVMTLLAGLLLNTQITFDWSKFTLVCVSALLAHIAVNAHNELSDHRSGLDFHTDRTPFSGGSGALQADPIAESGVAYFVFACLTITVVIGLYLVITSAFPLELAALGILGCAIIVSYTPLLNKFPILCLLSPGIGFGIIMLYGGSLVFISEHSIIIFIAALGMTALANNLLLLNQFPDREADKSHGRSHWVVRYSLSSARWVYTLQYGLAVVCFASVIFRLHLSPFYYLSLFPLTFAAVVVKRLFEQRDFKIAESVLGANVMSTVLTPLSMGIALCVAA